MSGVDSAKVVAIRQSRERSLVRAAEDVATAIEQLGRKNGLDAAAVTLVTGRVRDHLKVRHDELALELPEDATGPLAWTSLRRAGRATRVTLARHLALLQGTLVRGTANGLAASIAADRYLGELGQACGTPWTSITVPGLGEEHERFLGTVVVPFAGATAWELPIVAHEFGHVLEGSFRSTAGDGITQRLALQELVVKLADQQRLSPSLVREVLSDVFGAYAGGPAYACAVVLLRLDPLANPNIDPGGTHPSDAKRAEIVLATLRRLDPAGHPGPFASIASVLGATWDEMVAGAARGAPANGESSGSDHVPVIAAMIQALDQYVPQARFGAQQWESAARVELGSDARPVPDGGIAAILNAAWSRRLDSLLAGGDVPDSLGSEVLEAIVRGPNPGGDSGA